MYTKMSENINTAGEVFLSEFALEQRKIPRLEVIHNEMPCRVSHKQFGRRVLGILFNRLKLKRSASADISTPDPSYRLAYLGNVLTGWAKGEGCVEKPLSTLWKNYTQSSRPDVSMELTVSGGGLKVQTKEHGLTEYWANRITFCKAPKQFPRLFCWVYRHEGRRLRHELRCHAVLCSSNSVAILIEKQLRTSLTQALAEFRKDKISRQNARLSLANSVYENPSIPRRKIMLSTGSTNYRPPLERSKSAPKLTIIEEILGEEDAEYNENFLPSYKIRENIRLLQYCDSTSALVVKRQALRQKLAETSSLSILNHTIDKHDIIETSTNKECSDSDLRESVCDETVNERSKKILEEIIAKNLSPRKTDQNLELSWFRREDVPVDLNPLGTDENSLSSGTESAGTLTSENVHAVLLTEEHKRAEPDFKVGGIISSRVTSLERLTNCADLRKYCNLKHSSRILQEIPDTVEVSLIPVGEAHDDFSSLKVYKKRSLQSDRSFDPGDNTGSGSEGEADSACSDESGYSELIDCANNDNDIPSPISKVVMV